MATRDPIMAVLAEEDFTVNDCKTVACNDAEHYFSCAHAVLCTIKALGNERDGNPLNRTIQDSALAAVESLIELGMWQSHHERVAA